MFDVLLYCGVSLGIFLCFFRLQQKFYYALLNPLLLTVLALLIILLGLDISYQSYMQGAEYINYLLEPAVVLLGYPLYKQLYLLKAQWQKILLICALASFSGLSVCAVLAKIFGVESWLIASMVTLNITTAVSMATSVELGGNASINAVMVLIGGLTGSIFGVIWLKGIGLVQLSTEKNTLDSTQQKIIGLAIGSASHALGTSSIARQFPIGAAYSSSALILCAFISALIAPIYIPFILAW